METIEDIKKMQEEIARKKDDFRKKLEDVIANRKARAKEEEAKPVVSSTGLNKVDNVPNIKNAVNIASFYNLFDVPREIVNEAISLSKLKESHIKLLGNKYGLFDEVLMSDYGLEDRYGHSIEDINRVIDSMIKKIKENIHRVNTKTVIDSSKLPQNKETLMFLRMKLNYANWREALCILNDEEKRYITLYLGLDGKYRTVREACDMLNKQLTDGYINRITSILLKMESYLKFGLDEVKKKKYRLSRKIMGEFVNHNNDVPREKRAVFFANLIIEDPSLEISDIADRFQFDKHTVKNDLYKVLPTIDNEKAVLVRKIIEEREKNVYSNFFGYSAEEINYEISQLKDPNQRKILSMLLGINGYQVKTMVEIIRIMPNITTIDSVRRIRKQGINEIKNILASKKVSVQKTEINSEKNYFESNRNQIGKYIKKYCTHEETKVIFLRLGYYFDNSDSDKGERVYFSVEKTAEMLKMKPEVVLFLFREGINKLIDGIKEEQFETEEILLGMSKVMK